MNKIELLRESTGPMMLKIGLEIDLGMIQKSDTAIFEILIFRNFSGGQSPNFGPNWPFLDFDPLKNREKSKFQKSPRHFFVSSPKLSPDQMSALLGLQIPVTTQFYVKIDHFFYKVRFPLYLTIPPSRKRT